VGVACRAAAAAAKDAILAKISILCRFAPTKAFMIDRARSLRERYDAINVKLDKPVA